MQKARLTWIQAHQCDENSPLAQKRMLLASILMAVIMLLEVRWLSLQLYGFTCRGLVEEWALGLAYFAYRCARYDVQDHRFSFGSWSECRLLAGCCTIYGFPICKRLFKPIAIQDTKAMPIVIWGLAREPRETVWDAEIEHPRMKEIREMIAEFLVGKITALHVRKMGKANFPAVEL